VIAKFWALVEIIRAIFSLWKGFRDWQDRLKEREAQDKKSKREKAIEDAKNAKTPEEFEDAQRRIVDNNP
jgi:hypothetical protein